MKLNGRVFEEKIQVRYQETDQMGVVYYANYLVWFEIGRAGIFKELGYSYRQLENEGLILPIVESQAKYRRPAYYDDLLTIRTRITEFKNSKIVFGYEVVRDKDNEVLCTGMTTHVFCNKEMKPVHVKRSHPEFYQFCLKHLFVGGE